MKRILVAEDRAASRELITTVLESIGYDVIEAVDGEEALHKAAESPVDLIILDLQMPKLDGFQVISMLRANGRFAETPIVALTASAMQGDRERALTAGFSTYVTKPVDLAFLRKEVERLAGSP
jgi:CheY-like chemotaxis protein